MENINISISKQELLRIMLALQTASRVADDRGNNAHASNLLNLHDKLIKYL